MLVQTKDKNYVRDTNSKALLATDRKLVEDYKKRKAIFDEQTKMKEEINNLKGQMINLDLKLDEIKSILIKAIK